jgi:endonuclease/exonuclease/phosphatase family metal-dependent hydrolase
MRHFLFLLMLLGSCVATLTALPGAGAEPEEEGEVRVLSYNIYMRPRVLFRDGQLERLAYLPKQLKGYDVLVLSEVFDSKAREELLLQIQEEYPYVTEPLGAPRWVTQYGGVMIASKWPIEEEQHLLYGKVCSGSDCAAQKGAIYTRINKYGKRLNVFGTHLQAWPGQTPADVRRQQLEMLKQFIDSFAITSTEPVIIAGDINVDLVNFPGEYNRMLSILDASFPEPVMKELLYTFDPIQNPLCEGEMQEFLDYVLYSNKHLKPSQMKTSILRPVSDVAWGRYNGRDYFDLSDHFAVSADIWFE